MHKKLKYAREEYISGYLSEAIKENRVPTKGPTNEETLLGAIAEYPATPDSFIYMCRNAL